MRSVKDYLEYRTFLKDYYLHQKQSHAYYSLRYLGGKVSVDPSHLLKIFQLQRHIGDTLIDTFIEHCQLSGSDAEYFSNLVKFNKAKTDRDTRMYYERLLSLRGAGAHRLEKKQYEFYTKWYYTAILTMLDYYNFTDDYAALAARLSPAITPSQARKAIQLLKQLDLIRQRDDGSWELTHKIITTGDHLRSIAVATFQEETMRLAIDSLHEQAADKRNISTVTVTISEKKRAQMNEIIAQFRESLLKIARDETEADSVYQLNIQFFPLTK